MNTSHVFVNHSMITQEDPLNWWDVGSLFQTLIQQIGAIGIILYAIQYILRSYCCLSSGHQLIVKHLLPLQIYAEDTRGLITTFSNEKSDLEFFSADNPMRQVSKTSELRQATNLSKKSSDYKKLRLRKLIEQYDDIVMADKYCYVKLNSRTGENCCCCFTLEDNDVCYIISRLFTCKCCCKTDTTEREAHYERFLYSEEKGKGDKILLKTRRWRSGKCLLFKRSFYCCLQTNCKDCCNPYIDDHTVSVDVKDVFLGTYEPLVPSRYNTMKPVNVDKGAKRGSVRDVFDTNRQDAWHNFCGWWKLWSIENLKNAFKAELDTQMLAREFEIKF
jgi:hypothetical protein